MKFILLPIVALIGVFQYQLWFSESSVQDIARLKEMIKEQSLENERLKERNDRLRQKNKSLKGSGNASSNEAIEGISREKLGMIREGETLFIVADPDE